MAAARANLVSNSFCFLADFANEKSVEPKVYAEKSITDGTASLTKNYVFFYQVSLFIIGVFCFVIAIHKMITADSC